MVRNMCFSVVDVEVLEVGHPSNYQDADCQPSRHACSHERVDS
jgi:hypothetical protein